MNTFVLAPALREAIQRKLGPKAKLPKANVEPNDASETLDWLQENMPGEVEIDTTDGLQRIWLWYALDGYNPKDCPTRRFIKLEQWLATPPPTPEHEAEQPHPNEVD